MSANDDRPPALAWALAAATLGLGAGFLEPPALGFGGPFGLPLAWTVVLSNLALAVLLIGAGPRLASAHRSLGILLCAGSIGTIAAVAIGLDLLGRFPLQNHSIPVMIDSRLAVAALILALGLAWVGRRLHEQDETAPLELPLITGLSVILVTIALAVVAFGQERSRFRTTVVNASNVIRGQLQRGLYSRLLEVHRAIELAVRVHEPTTEWEQALRVQLEPFGGVRAVAELGPNAELEWIVPSVGYDELVVTGATDDDGTSIFVYEPVALPTGAGFAIYERVFHLNEEARYRVGVFEYEPLFHGILGESMPDYNVAIYHGAQLLFARGADPGRATSAEWSDHGKLDWLGFAWDVSVSPTPASLASSQPSAGLAGAMIAGNVFALLLALSIQLAQMAHRRADELGTLNRELEVEIDERKRVEEKFLQSQKMEAVGRLAGGVAHDFNNYLTVVHGYTELVRPLVGGDAAARYIAEILKASESASDLTQQLLAFSRRQSRKTRAIDLYEAVRDIEGMLARLIGEDVALVTLGESSACIVEADPNQLQQIIINLAVNARDAMPQGGTLTIAVQPIAVSEGEARKMGVTGPGRYADLIVRDTGVGMDDATITNIFEPFFTTKARGRGTGLGLSTVYGIVQQSGGNVTAASAPGTGTTLHVFLPLLDRDEPSDDDRPATSATDKSALGYEATVLLVEDEDAVRDWIEQVLTTHGFRVLVARNGEEALVKLERLEQASEKIHLLVTDVIMPRMGGAHLASILSERQPHVPVLFVSGYPDRPLPEDSAGDANYLAKPFTAETLLRKVRAALDRTIV